MCFYLVIGDKILLLQVGVSGEARLLQQLNVPCKGFFHQLSVLQGRFFRQVSLHKEEGFLLKVSVP